MKRTIRYFSFYDVPRTFIFERDGKIYLLECEFDDDLDNYPDQYELSIVQSDRMFSQLENWKSIEPLPKTPLGKVPVSSVHFDKSVRKFVDDDFLRELSSTSR